MISRSVYRCRSDKVRTVMAFTATSARLKVPFSELHPYLLWPRSGLQRNSRETQKTTRKQQCCSGSHSEGRCHRTSRLLSRGAGLTSAGTGLPWAHSSFSSWQRSIAFPNNPGAGFCAAPQWGVPHLLQVTYIQAAGLEAARAIKLPVWARRFQHTSLGLKPSQVPV